MIKSVTIVSDRDRAIRFDLQRPEKSGFAVIDIDGLGPTKNKINFSSDHSLNVSHESSVPELRNITIKLQYYGIPDDIEKARRSLYSYFGVGRMIKVIVQTGEKYFQTNGYTESLEPDIFSGDQTYSISIMCDSPYFKSAGENDSNLLESSKVRTNVFEFPFSNQTGTKSLEFTRLENVQNSDGCINVINDGDIDIGFEIEFFPYKKEVTDDFYMVVNNRYIRFNSTTIGNIINEDIIDADTYLKVDTNEGFRKIFVGVPQPIGPDGQLIYVSHDITAMMYILKQNEWPQFLPGSNLVKIAQEPYSLSKPTMTEDISSIHGECLYLGV